MERNRRIMFENFSKFSVRCKPQMQEAQTHKTGYKLKQTTQQTLHIATLYSSYKKSNIKKGISKEAKKENTLPIGG